MLLKEKRSNVKSVGLTPFTSTSHFTFYLLRLTPHALHLTLYALRLTHMSQTDQFNAKCEDQTPNFLILIFM